MKIWIYLPRTEDCCKMFLGRGDSKGKVGLGGASIFRLNADANLLRPAARKSLFPARSSPWDWEWLAQWLACEDPSARVEDNVGFLS
jgi:hypothetical protein